MQHRQFTDFDQEIWRSATVERFGEGKQRTTALGTIQPFAQTYRRGHGFKRYLEDDPMVTVLFEGVAAKVRSTQDGRRRIVGFLLPGEASGLPGPDADTSNYDLMALDHCRAACMTRDELAVLEERDPSVTRYLTFTMQHQLHMLQDILVLGTGRRTEDRLLVLLTNIHQRLRRSNRAEPLSMDVPMRQIDFADALGVTSVHMSRAFAQLRDRGVEATRNGQYLRVRFPDTMEAAAGLQPVLQAAE